MNNYKEWAARHPQAARELQILFNVLPQPEQSDFSLGKSEAWAQQQVRFAVAKAGAMAWRNNVGATPAKCPACSFKQQPVRYGLANDSAKLNKQIKSHDLILAIPRKITQDMVGKTFAQFGSIEVKKPGWVYTGDGQESGQAAWASLILSLGGFAAFSTGEIEL